MILAWFKVVKFWFSQEESDHAPEILQAKQYVGKRLRYSISAPITMSVKNTTPCFDLSFFPWPMAEMDEKGKVLHSSPAFKEMLQACRLNDFGKVLEETTWLNNLSIEKILKKKLNTSGYFKSRDSRQILHWYRIKLTPTESKGFMVYIENKTEEKIKQDLASMAEDTALVGSWEVDLLFNQVYWSDTTRKIHEVPMDFVPDLESGINFYKPGFSRDRITQVVSRTIETGEPFDVELQILTAKGNEKWVRAVGKSDFVDGKCTKFYGTFQDIDRQIKNRFQVQRLHERIDLAATSAQIGFWDLDILKNELYWDDVMYDLYGVKREEFNGDFDAWEKTVHPDDKEAALLAVEDAISGKSEFNTSFRILTGRGDIKYISGRGQVIRDTQGQAVRMVGANTDITKMKRNETRLRNLLEVTEKQNQSLLNFAHIVSHNLRSNSSNLSLLTGMFKSGKMPVEKAIEMIQVSAERLEETVVDLNEVVQVKTNTDESATILIRKTLLEVLEGLNATWVNAGAKLNLDLDEKLKVKGIKPYIESVIHNMLTNALKYSKPDEPLKLQVYNEEDKQEVRVYFKDNGQGIDLEKHKDKIFGMYKTFHGNQDAKGIGLFLSQNQMESMGGKITVESSPKHGTTFCLHFKKEA